MTTQDLKQAVSMLYDMELDICFLEHSIDEIEKRINAVVFPVKPIKRESKYEMKKMLIFMAVGGALGAFIGMVGSDALGFIVCGLGVIFSYFIYEWIRCTDTKECDNEYQNALNEYGKENSKQKGIRCALMQQKDDLVTRRNEAKNKLEQFYDLAGIDEKYRNLIAIGYMKDFLSLSICTKLEGTDGLYYMIRKELRWDTLETSLSRISSQLDRSIATERAILDNLHEYQRRSEEMISRVLDDIQRGIHSSTAIATYNAERVRKEIEYQNHFLRYGYWN